MTNVAVLSQLPGIAIRQANTATIQIRKSTLVPAMLTNKRFHFDGISQASETLQKKHGMKKIHRSPISWTSPPYLLQARPCPYS